MSTAFRDLAVSRTRNGEAAYPDPFFDIASTRLPKSRRKLLEMCYLFATTHPQLGPIVSKLAKFPITKVVLSFDQEIEGDKRIDDLKRSWLDTIERELDFYAQAEAAGLDFFAFGNAFITVHRPFKRSWTCQTCDHSQPGESIKGLQVRNKGFVAHCEHCKSPRPMKGSDEYIESSDGLRIVRLNPMNIEIVSYQLTGHKEYIYEVPTEIRRAIRRKPKPNMRLINRTPWVYIEAALEDRKILFEEDSICHMWQPGPSGMDDGWGHPILLPGLKDAYLNQVYKKADETLANERLVPLRWVFPQATSQDPLSTINLRKFTGFLGQGIRAWRRDKNLVLPSPFPVGTAQLGGEAAQFNTAPLRQLAISEIISSTGMPAGFLSEGMTWSGGSVQLRMLENMLNGYLRALNKLLHFIVKQVSIVTNRVRPIATLKPFRMIDDVQMLSFLMQLADAREVSYEELLSRMDLNRSEQHAKILSEIEGRKNIQIEEQMMGAQLALRSVGAQVAAQDAQEGWTDTLKEVEQDSQVALEVGATRRSWRVVESEKEQQEQQAEQQQAEQQQAQMQSQGAEQEAKAQREQALARKHESDAKLNEAEADVVDDGVLDNLDAGQGQYVMQMAQGLLEDEENRDARLNSIRSQDPEFAKMIEAGMARLSGASEQADPISKAISDLRNQASSPKAMAQKIRVMPPQIKDGILQRLIEEDVNLAMDIIAELNGPTSGSSTPSPRPLPLARPPRRTSG